MNLIRIMPAEEREMGPKEYSTQSIAAILPRRAGDLLRQMRRSRPRIHAITNAAAQTFTANLLLAAGAIPSLTVAPEEVISFTEKASALLINLGTLDDDRRKAFPIAIKAARQAQRPWVLDPVFADVSPVRLDVALDLLAQKPDVLRCNADEFDILAKGAGSPRQRIASFAAKHSTVVALTGATDIVSDGMRNVSIANGHPLMGYTTAMGCAGTVLIAAFSSLSRDRLEAAAAALLVIGLAGEIAGKNAPGPGSFPARFLDTLYTLDSDTIIKQAKVS